MDFEAAKKVVEIDPEFHELIKTLPPPPEQPTIASLRAKIAPIEAALSTSLPPPDIDEYTTPIPTKDGTQILLRIHRPRIASAESPLIVYFHAGGYCVGSSALCIPKCRALVQRFNAVCVNVDYRHAPEHVFPTPINDCWDALQWAAAHATDLGANPAKGFIVGGESSGGNAALVLAHLARDNKLSPPLTGQVLSVPSCLPPDTVPDKYKPFFHSWDQAAASPQLYGYHMATMFRTAHDPDMRSPLFAAFNDPNGHADLPPAYFQICGLDPVRDEGLVYEMVLREECGVATKVDVYPGLPHAFWQLFHGLKASQRAEQDMFRGFEWLLERSA